MKIKHACLENVNKRNVYDIMYERTHNANFKCIAKTCRFYCVNY